jgi:hypothetical protein
MALNTLRRISPLMQGVSLMVCAAALLSFAHWSSAVLVARGTEADSVIEVTGGHTEDLMIADIGTAFKVVSFAQPLEGDVRWQDLAPVKPWTLARDAGAFGRTCTRRNLNQQKPLLGNQPTAAAYPE